MSCRQPFYIWGFMRKKLTAIVFLILLISVVTAQRPKTRKTGPKALPPHQSARVPGQLDGDAGGIITPASVRANKDFEVTVRTGGNGCWTKGDASVVLGESSADIFVYDMTNATKPGTMCTMIYKQFDHQVTLRFETKGEAIIRVWARGAGDTPLGGPVIVEKRITVK